MKAQQQIYMSEWHDNFSTYIRGLLSFIETLIILPQATKEDKLVLDQVKLILNGKEAKEIEQTLAEGIVKQDTLNRIAKLNKDLVDIAVSHISLAPLAKDLLKQLTYFQIEQNKRGTLLKLNELQIPIV